MVVSTNSNVPQLRKTLTEMLLSEHLNADPGGRPNELTDLALELGAEAPLILPDAKREPYADRNKLMGYEPDTCILCNRCVRYTQEVMQCSALSLEGRGPEARIVPTWGKSWLDTECELCGGCLSTCPTGAIYEKFLEGAGVEERALEQVKTTCTFCGVGCQLDLNVDPETKRIVKVTSKPEYVSNEGNLCVKGRFAFNFVHHPDRLTEPLVRGEDGELHATTWEHALEVAATGLKGVMERHSPAVDRSARLRPADERGELPDPEARPDGAQDPLRPLVRSHLTRSDPLRPGQVVRQRRFHQLDPRDRERPLPARDRVEHDGGAPGARPADQEGGAERRHARRRRPARDLADEAREAAPAAATRLGRVAAERDHARDPRRGAAGRRLHRGALRGLRVGARGRRALHPRGGGAGHRRPAEAIRATAREYAGERHAAIFYTLGITEHACGVDNIWSLANLVLMTGHLGYESTA